MDVVAGSFVWDSDKERRNINKHGVDFVTAAGVFKDPHVKIFVDSKHSLTETRMFAVSKVRDKVITVRFTYRGNTIRIFGAGYWRTGRRYYEKNKRA